MVAINDVLQNLVEGMAYHASGGDRKKVTPGTYLCVGLHSRMVGHHAAQRAAYPRTSTTQGELGVYLALAWTTDLFPVKSVARALP